MDLPPAATLSLSMNNNSTPRAGALAAAHRGYAYQDLLTAYLLVKGLIAGFEQIVIDKKVVKDDRFDDVETRISGRRLRRQVKSSQQSNRILSFQDFNDVRSSLRFDRLVQTFVAESTGQAEEYRLCATWGAPGLDDELASLLQPFDVPGTFDGCATTLMRLDASKLWTIEGSLVFPNAHQALATPGDLTREDVLRFCQRFVIEVGLPQASLDLEAPGPLERLVLGLLEDGIGIGRYPNDARRVEDVAALAVFVAMTARTVGETLTKAELIRRLDIRTDFGRVAQAFPIDRAVMQERASTRQNLASAVTVGGIHFLLAGPGSGKSWVLTQLAEDLSASGVVVARHYCFLEPGDELVERRVTTDVFIGNLMGELSDTLQRHSVEQEGTYAADLDELERLLAYAAQDGRRVVVIVDGMDHIARVLAGSQSLSDTETDIVERLATLQLPEGVSLVIGSQPGQHLDPIRRTSKRPVVEHFLAAWSGQEIEGLAVSLGVSAALDEVGLDEDARRRSVFDTLTERSEGNPLYARYLSRSLVFGLRSAQIVSPVEWLESTPVIEGDISRYYQHLYDSASKEAQAIADVLGVLDFAVTAAEVREIVGTLLEDRVADALVTLSPVLSQAAAQGGVRVFHESFRRFMMTAIEARGTSLTKILKPVAHWLESKEFFVDAKSYRFMLPVMRRSGREPEILLRVSTDFVTLSVQHGHPQDAIERNLALAADVAARNLDWPALMRIAELSRALDACFSDGNNNWTEYWQTFLVIFGPQATADRLLFDGRPTLERREGLSVCAAIDEAGISAPWREYFALPFDSENDSDSSQNESYESPSPNEENYLAVIQGRLRMGQYYRVVRSVLAHLSDPEGNATSPFIRKVAQLLAEQVSATVVRQLVKRANSSYRGKFALSPAAGCALLLGLADAARATPELCGPTLPYASFALAFAATSDEVLWCLNAGAPLQRAHAMTVKHSDLNVFRSKAPRESDTSTMREWVSTVRLLARTGRGREELGFVLQNAQGEGWYLCWIRFVLRIAIAEALAAEGAVFDAAAAFSELTVDTRPFVGTPRACDLYFVRGLINESLKRALSLLRSAQEWQHAIEQISEARNNTATYLDREDGGPITAGAFISILLSFAANPQAKAAIRAALERKLDDEEASGTYYSTHAEFRMRLARLQAASGERQVAVEHWNKAGQFLTAYTFHKDVALFDLIQSVTALKDAPGHVALRALVRLQPLVSAVLRHTDRRETKNAPNAWFRALLEVDEVRAVETLSRTFAADVGGPSWIALEALRDVLKKISISADPLIADALWDTLLFEIEYEGEGEKMVNERLVPLERLAQSGSVHLEDRFVCVSAQAQNDSRAHATGIVPALQAFADRHGIHFQRSSIRRTEIKEGRGTASTSMAEKKLSEGTRPAFPVASCMVDIIAAVRRIAKEQVEEEDMYGLLTLPLSYLLSEMVDRGEEAQAQRVLYFLVHEAKEWNHFAPHPIGRLAQCLDEAGHARLAAVAYVLKFTNARGSWGWLSFGGREFTPALQRALELDTSNALQALANETARKLREGGFNGLSRHLVQQIALWGDVHGAAAAWDEAFCVMETRLPLAGNARTFEPLELDDDVVWSLDERLVALLLTRSSDPSVPRRVAALAGFARLIESHGKVLPRPVRWFLTGCTTVASVQAALQLLLESPWDVSAIVSFNEDILRAYAKSESWSLSTLAARLLSVINVHVNVASPSRAQLDESPSHHARRLAAFGDVGEILPHLAEVWPDLPEIVARRMQRGEVDNKSFKELVRERMDLAVGRTDKNRPEADVLSWPSELVVAILDNVLCGLSEHLWRTGQWVREFDNDLLEVILPDLETRIALYASLGPRPAAPFPTEAHRSLRPIVQISEDDPAYRGWIRLAVREIHYFRSDSRHWDTPNRRAVLTAGVVRTALDGTVPAAAGPFGSSGIWPWRKNFREEDALEDATLPQLIKRFDTKDWLGPCTTLVPPLALRHKAKLQPPAFGAPLRWRDQSGKPAVILRTWRLRGEGLHVESYSTYGCSLLLRPDLEDTLHSTFGGPLKELSQVHLTELTD
ncbi:hypothetical protein bAD24_I09460 [Burkholderia sp. AD24]|nr:hypothetical protein bAD24_I09460 [Burkholderia sp. AD24]